MILTCLHGWSAPKPTLIGYIDFHLQGNLNFAKSLLFSITMPLYIYSIKLGYWTREASITLYC